MESGTECEIRKNVTRKAPASIGSRPTRLDQPVEGGPGLLEPAPRHRESEGEAVDGRVAPLPQERKGPDVVLVGVREKHAVDSFARERGEVGGDPVDAGKRLVGERDADVDENAGAGALEPEDVLAELADAPERDDLERRVHAARQPRASSRNCSGDSSSARARGELAESLERPLPVGARTRRRERVGERLPARVEAERRQGERPAGELGLGRRRPRSQLEHAEDETLGRGRNAPGGRSKRILPEARVAARTER